MKTIAVKPMRCEIATEGLLWIDKIATGVGIILFNPQHKIAAGVHVLRGLSQGTTPENPAYFADTAIQFVLAEFEKMGIQGQISVAIAGGAAMLSSGEADNMGNRLVSAIKGFLDRKNLPVKLESVGGSKLRTIILNIDEGKIKIT
jgi:chemotaxis receptor (MCP) glutamine deamidase CheD